MDASWIVVAGTSDSTLWTATLTNLETNVSYDVQVRAENDEGEGVWSESGMATPRTLEILIKPTAIKQTQGFANRLYPIDRLTDGSGLSATPTADNYASVTHYPSTLDERTHWETRDRSRSETDNYFLRF